MIPELERSDYEVIRFPGRPFRDAWNERVDELFPIPCVREPIVYAK